MKFGTFAATTLLAVAAVGISAATVNAEPAAPAAPAPEIKSEGVDQGVAYETSVDQKTQTITTAVRDGLFELTPDGAKAVLKAVSGAVVAEVPLKYDVSGSEVEVAHEISADGSTLELTPTVTAENIGEMRPVSSMARLTDELNKNVAGVAVGAVVGGLLGALVGLGFLSIITGPIGLVVGAVAGGYIMGGQPFGDAVTAVLRGEP
ncbi:hypothetical protein [Nocardia sp. NPDC024068]|uniref:hypothetical protein n=1 Tax=Nocardia sp. NPDC024068 TaxID=3157197 RepID=UPI00340765EE